MCFFSQQNIYTLFLTLVLRKRKHYFIFVENGKKTTIQLDETHTNFYLSSSLMSNELSVFIVIIIFRIKQNYIYQI